MWMSLDRARIPSEMIRSTSRTTGRWLASASEVEISSGATSFSWTSSAELSIPSSSLSTAFSGRYSSSSRSAILRSEEHTSELQSRLHLVCRLLLEKKKQKTCTDTSQ